MAMSADGKIAPSAPGPGRLTSAFDRAHMDLVRAHADAVLIGARTLRDANPDMIIKDAAAIKARRARGHTQQPLAVVVSRTGRLPADARVFDSRPQPGAGLAPPPTPWVFVDQDAKEATQSLLGTRAKVIALAPAGDHHGGAAYAILEALWRHDVRHLLIEGGGQVLWPFVQARALDRLYVTLAPCLLGGEHAPTLLAGAGLSIADRVRLHLAQAKQNGDEMYLTYDVRHPLSPNCAATPPAQGEP